MNLEIDSYDFDTNSHLHGKEHTERVMQLVRHLGKIGNLSESVILESYCAAVIHDMARKHDYECDQHGQWAVESKLPLWKDRFIELGLKQSQIEAVAFAVYWHCKDYRDVPDSEYLQTLHLLQDADALDRVRFAGKESIRLDYLHFSFTKQEIPFAEKLLWEY